MNVQWPLFYQAVLLELEDIDCYQIYRPISIKLLYFPHPTRPGENWKDHNTP